MFALDESGSECTLWTTLSSNWPSWTAMAASRSSDSAMRPKGTRPPSLEGNLRVTGDSSAALKSRGVPKGAGGGLGPELSFKSAVGRYPALGRYRGNVRSCGIGPVPPSWIHLIILNRPVAPS